MRIYATHCDLFRSGKANGPLAEAVEPGLLDPARCWNQCTRFGIFSGVTWA